MLQLLFHEGVFGDRGQVKFQLRSQHYGARPPVDAVFRVLVLIVLFCVHGPFPGHHLHLCNAPFGLATQVHLQSSYTAGASAAARAFTGFLGIWRHAKQAALSSYDCNRQRVCSEETLRCLCPHVNSTACLLDQPDSQVRPRSADPVVAATSRLSALKPTLLELSACSKGTDTE